MNGRETLVAGERRIGFMADSHGRPETIAAALDLFDRCRCEAVFHLGDICDSARPQSAAECVDRLIQAEVRAVRGNNDHNLVAGRRPGTGFGIPLRVERFLNGLPLRRMISGAVLAHGLPFDREMGLSCMIAPLDASAIRRTAETFAGRILFRGHSHAPEAVRLCGESLVRSPLAPGKIVELTVPGIVAVTCGALTRGLCMIWSPDAGVAVCHSILPGST